MKNRLSTSLAVGRRTLSRRPFTLLAVVVASLLTSCITEQQVKSIVTDANQQMLMADVATTGTQLQPDPRNATKPGPSVIARIDNFIAQHPDEPALTSPLRLRQAFLYLNEKAISGAQAAFEAIDEKGLNTDRDKTIYRLREIIVWWYDQASTSGTNLARDLQGIVRNNMATLATEADKAKAIPELQDYLLEMRAWIGLKVAGGLEGAARANAIKTALDPYGTVIGNKEGEQIASGNVDTSQPPISRTIRIVIRTDALLNEAADLAKGVTGAPTPVLSNAFLQRGLAAKMAR